MFLSHLRAPGTDELTNAGPCGEQQTDARQGGADESWQQVRALVRTAPHPHTTPEGLAGGALGSHPREYLSLLIVCQRKPVS